jgi:inner membrane protein
VDNITHSLFALTIANAGLRRAGRGSTAALVIASNIPDIEILTAFTGGRVGYLAAHRGPTHGALGLGLAVATAVTVWLAVRVWSRGERPASFRSLLAVSTIGFLGHITLDLATSYGTRVLSPFSGTWYGVDWMPIVDVYLLAILAAALVVGFRRPAWRTRAALAAMALMAGDYALRAATHAVALGDAVALQEAALPGSVGRLGPGFHYLDGEDPAALPAALPTLFSPFKWRLIVRSPEGFRVEDIDVLDRGAPPDVITFPNERGPLFARAAAAPTARVFLDFSRFPAGEALPHRNGDVTVHWYDMRFAQHQNVPGDRRSHTSPFGVWVRLSKTGEVLGQGLGPG